MRKEQYYQPLAKIRKTLILNFMLKIELPIRQTFCVNTDAETKLNSRITGIHLELLKIMNRIGECTA